MKIAVLITIYKRKNETIKCLDLLFKNNFELDVFISDSNSNNGIEYDLKNFKNIFYKNIGDNVFWNKGMNYSWEAASNFSDYDFFIWLNNDTYLNRDALKIIFDDYNKVEKKSIIVGTTKDKKGLTYGGRLGLKDSILVPNGYPQEVFIMNGNFVLIPKVVFSVLGYLDSKFTHSIGDIDYGLRAIEKGISVYIASKTIGLCNNNEFVWYNSNSFKARLKNLGSPKGVPIKEYFYFNKKHFGILSGVKFLLATFAALLFPRLYKIVKS